MTVSVEFPILFVIFSLVRQIDCMVSGFIVLITCQSFGMNISARMKSLLCTLFREHLNRLFEETPCTPLKAYPSEFHDVRIYQNRCHYFEPQTSKALKAFWISAENVKMNQNRRCIGVNSDVTL